MAHVKRFRSPRRQHQPDNAMRAALRNVFGSPPASTVTRLPSVLNGLRGSASALVPRVRLRLCPKGRRDRKLVAITQARNTSAIIAAYSAWVPEPCWAAGFGSQYLLFRCCLGLTKRPYHLCTPSIWGTARGERAFVRRPSNRSPAAARAGFRATGKSGSQRHLSVAEVSQEKSG